MNPAAPFSVPQPSHMASYSVVHRVSLMRPSIEFWIWLGIAILIIAMLIVSRTVPQLGGLARAPVAAEAP